MTASLIRLGKSTLFRFASSTSASEVAFLLVCYSLLFLILPSAVSLCFSPSLQFSTFLILPSATYLPSVPHIFLERRQEPLEAGEANPPDDDRNDQVREEDEAGMMMIVMILLMVMIESQWKPEAEKPAP